jgi:hypothetical protein
MPFPKGDPSVGTAATSWDDLLSAQGATRHLAAAEKLFTSRLMILGRYPKRLFQQSTACFSPVRNVRLLAPPFVDCLSKLSLHRNRDPIVQRALSPHARLLQRVGIRSLDREIIS